MVVDVVLPGCDVLVRVMVWRCMVGGAMWFLAVLVGVDVVGGGGVRLCVRRWCG